VLSSFAKPSIPSARWANPGEQIQAVISVGMLSEGWDAKTVTHIMGCAASLHNFSASRSLAAVSVALPMR